MQKIFTVPSTAEQMKVPFARVNHAKYMVTDRVLYIGMLSLFNYSDPSNINMHYDGLRAGI